MAEELQIPAHEVERKRNINQLLFYENVLVAKLNGLNVLFKISEEQHIDKTRIISKEKRELRKAFREYIRYMDKLWKVQNPSWFKKKVKEVEPKETIVFDEATKEESKEETLLEKVIRIKKEKGLV